MKAIIPAAGSGTRMYPLGVSTPKCLTPILNKPILWWTLTALKQNGIHEVILVINPSELGQKIREYVEKVTQKSQDSQAGEFADMKIEFVVQEKQEGSAHVVQMVKEFFPPDEEFIVLNGDDLYGPKNIAAVMKEPGFVVLGKEVKDPEKWGVFEVDERGNLMKVVEKPEKVAGKNSQAVTHATAPTLASIGCMKLTAKVFEIYEKIPLSSRGEYELTDSLNLLAKEVPIKVVTAPDYWLPVGYPWHILDATEFLLPLMPAKIEGTVEENVTIQGNVILPKSSTIKAGTYIEGNVLVGENTVIGPNAYLRQNISIGDNCKVGFSVELKNSVIGNGTHIPHLSYIGDSVLGEDVNFAGGSLVANFRHDGKNVSTPIKGIMTDTGRVKLGTIIGDHVHLGIGTHIYPGRKIWPGKTTLPAEVVDKDIS